VHGKGQWCEDMGRELVNERMIMTYRQILLDNFSFRHSESGDALFFLSDLRMPSRYSF